MDNAPAELDADSLRGAWLDALAACAAYDPSTGEDPPTGGFERAVELDGVPLSVSVSMAAGRGARGSGGRTTYGVLDIVVSLGAPGSAGLRELTYASSRFDCPTSEAASFDASEVVEEVWAQALSKFASNHAFLAEKERAAIAIATSEPNRLAAQPRL